MKLLSIDTSGPVAGAAVYRDGRIASRTALESGNMHSETVVQLIDAAMNLPGLLKKELDAIAVTTGPGSFTGLRIGLSVAKAMAQALQIPVIGVNTLDALCYVQGEKGLRCAVMDARRAEVYSAAYLDGERIIDYGVRPLPAFLDSVCAMGADATFAGDGVRAYRADIARALGARARFVPEPFCVQCASAVAMLAAQTQRECYGDAYTVQPDYFRLSQAEREAKERR